MSIKGDLIMDEELTIVDIVGFDDDFKYLTELVDIGVISIERKLELLSNTQYPKQYQQGRDFVQIMDDAPTPTQPVHETQTKIITHGTYTEIITITKIYH